MAGAAPPQGARHGQAPCVAARGLVRAHKEAGEATAGGQSIYPKPSGTEPRKWERTGTIVECKDHDQYAVKVDGTGRITLRNRKFLRLLKLIPKPSTSKTPLAPDTVAPTLPTYVPETGDTSSQVSDQLRGQHTYPPATPVRQVSQPLYTPYQALVGMNESVRPISPPASPARSVPGPRSTSASPDVPNPVVDTVPDSPIPVTRPQRTRRSNTLFHPETWDLSGLEEDSLLTRQQVSDLFLHIAQRLGDKGF